MELHRLQPLKKAYIVKRPSAHIKSPYVADIIVDGENYLGHTPALGCCGLAEKESNVFVTKLGEKTKCDYRIQISAYMDENSGKEILVGIAPKLAEVIAGNALEKQLIYNLSVKTLAREKKVLNSRFDFIGTTHDDTQFILEVKNVPLADYVDMDAKERKKIDTSHIPYNEKIAYFPDGYRKSKKETVSERALKHVNELREIKQAHSEIRCILLFVIQRNDVAQFQPSRIDPIYLEAVRDAWMSGVEIKTLQVEWDTQGVCKYISNNLPIMLYDDCNMDL
jgi:DNA-binding sugar fermentation-stimulating protein